MKYPPDSELADLTGFSVAHVKRMQNFDFSYISTDTQPDEEMDGIFLDTLSSEDDPDAELHRSDCRQRITEILNRLTPREKSILRLHYGLNGSPPLSLEEIGRQLGLTRERIRQIESRALTKIRNMPEAASLHDFLIPD